MRYVLALLTLVLLLVLPREAVAQFQGMVVQTCGTLPQAYSPGSTRLPAIDVNGNLCSSSSLTPGQLLGTATNDNANAGNVGEYIESQIAIGTAQSLTSGTTINVTQITLTPGDWEVGGNVVFTGGATTTVQVLVIGMSDVSATSQVAPASRQTTFPYNAITIFTPQPNHFYATGPTRWSIAVSTTIYLVARATFAVSTCSTNGGHLWARRMR